MNHITLLSLGAVAAFATSACSSNTEDLFGGVGGSGGSTSKGVTTGSQSTGSQSTTSVTTGSQSTGSQTTSSVSTGPGGTSSVSTGSMSSVSSSSGGPQNTVTCNSTPCAVGEICCFNPTGPGDHCSAPNACNNGFVQFSCNGPEDCPGQVCCAKIQNQNVVGIACQNTCNQNNQIVVCSQAQPNVCQGNTMCQSAANFLGDGYNLCLPN